MAFSERLAIMISANGTAAVSEFNRVGTSASRSLATADRSTSRFSSGLRAAGAAALGFAGVAVLGLTRAAQAAAEEEVAIAKLNNSIQNSPTLVGASTDAFLEQAAAMQRVTVFQDDVTIGAQAMLATFRLTQDEILSLTPLVADLAAKFDVDMSRAAINVGKALQQGSLTALQRWGIIVDENAFAADRFSAVMAALRENAGGFAEEEGQTFSGQMTILSNRIGEVVEGVGEDLVPFLESLGDAAEDLAPFLEGAASALSDLASTDLSDLQGFINDVHDLGGEDVFGAISGLFNGDDAPQLNPFNNLAPQRVWDEYARNIFQITKYDKDAEEANQDLASSFGVAAEEAEAASDAIDSYLDSITRGPDAAMDMAEAQDELWQSLLASRQNFDINNEAGRENVQNMQELIGATAGAVQAQIEFAGAGGNVYVAQRRANSAIRGAIGDLEAARNAGLITGAQFERYRQQILNVPHDVTTDVRTSGIDSALAQLATLQARLNLVQGSYTAHINILTSGTIPNDMPGLAHAHGGFIREGEFGYVHGGEMVSQHGGVTHVTPAGSVQQGGYDERRLARCIAKELALAGVGAANVNVQVRD